MSNLGSFEKSKNELALTLYVGNIFKVSLITLTKHIFHEISHTVEKIEKLSKKRETKKHYAIKMGLEPKYHKNVHMHISRQKTLTKIVQCRWQQKQKQKQKRNINLYKDNTDKLTHATHSQSLKSTDISFECG